MFIFKHLRYNYSREDEEIYKEFLEINNELIPHLMKSVTMTENLGGYLIIAWLALNVCENLFCFL